MLFAASFRRASIEASRRVCVVAVIAVVALAIILCAHSGIAFSQIDNESCFDCHDDSEAERDEGGSVEVVAKRYEASIHGDFDCVDCHAQDGDYEDFPHYDKYVPVDCGECHDDVVEDYETSVHHLGRGGVQNGTAATCLTCHSMPHYTASYDDTASSVYRSKIPVLCGECHTETKMTDNYVHLPIALPSYYASVHGAAWKAGNEEAAVCTDCHSPHRARIAEDPESLVNFRNVPATCGACHEEIAAEYGESIHGRASALGIGDAPTCATCHDEHVAQHVGDTETPFSPQQRANKTCGNCHTNPAMLSKYGVNAGVVESYLDSYHAWAVDRGSQIAATCIDCHNVHDIRSSLDPASSVHDDNVTETCARCHEGTTQAFATSYTHASALDARSVHGWVRLLYLGLIAVVLGGMAIHNIIVARYELHRHFSRRRREAYVKRWRKAERMQHFVLLISFFGLAITGFALRYSDQWWVHLIGLGFNEGLRANLHRAFGIIMVVASFYHMIWVVVTRRGRLSLRAMAPGINDVRQFGENMAFHLEQRRKRPAFGMFDYTQKAEYWAVVWGTWVMVLTGLVLWYPTVATGIAPAWIVRVSEVIHFYEAILAVSAIFIWHLFYVIFMPSEYPMSTTWVDGRIPAEEYEEMHRGEFEGGTAPEIQAPSPKRRKPWTRDAAKHSESDDNEE